ncbi:MAG: aspartate--tRNA ligase [Planctomycetes bacterium]|nr:aspartate--tRNA ligase [Planctomycetota bacterium]
MSQHPYRTHTCNQLRAEHVGQRVRLGGWLYRKRDQKHQVFVDLRDHHGVTQVVFDESTPALTERVRDLRVESILIIDGEVVRREKPNDKLATGEIELKALALTVDSEAAELPIQVAIPKGESDRDGEELRLRWRFLDLRRERLHRNIVVRDVIIRAMRDHMHAEGFVEFQTPILTNSSPEGARDYLVPSRVHPGKFFALPQAPQQWKQLLMASGFDRYFQIAPCFRDEDARADRAPGEFYQLDLELAFATQEDVFGVIERLYQKMPDLVAPHLPDRPKKRIQQFPFPRLPYWEVVDRFGTDKPDLRFGLELTDVSEAVRGTGFGLFADALGKRDGRVKALRLPGLGKDGKGAARRLEKAVKEKGYGGLPHLIYTAGEVDGSLKKALTADEVARIKAATGAEADDLVVFGFGSRLQAAKVLGEVRLLVGREQNLADPTLLAFCFVVDFPFYELDDEGKVQFSHNPFSMPQGGMDALNGMDPLEIKAYQYDICCNGVELSSGAIRNHRPDVMYRAFELAGYSKADVDREFGHMIQAFRYGTPPHGGMAPGVDRSIMIFLDEPNIREVVAFPKNQKCQDLLVNAPSFVRKKQLDELHIRIVPPEGVDVQILP